MDVRLAQTPADYATFAALATDYEHDLPPQLRHADADEQLRDPAATFGPPNAAFIATIEGRPAGCIAMFHHDAQTAIIRRLYVAHAFRGHGVGRTLVTAVIAEATKRSYERLALDTDPTLLESAYRLYLSLGFEDCEPYAPMHYEHAVCMQLRLRGRHTP